MTTQVKYKLGEREDNGLCRVIALRAFSDVATGDVGGYVESERNLAHTGDAWVFGNARVSGNAQVSGNARVSGNAQVSEDARVSVVCTAIPKVITGLWYTLTITDEHLRAGCQVHTFQEWRNKTEREVLAMDGKAALVFYKETLIPLMDALKLGV